jgi:predicted Zn-dependent protease
MFSTHPMTEKRIEEARTAVTDNEEYSRFSQNQPDPNTGRFKDMKSLLTK